MGCSQGRVASFLSVYFFSCLFFFGAISSSMEDPNVGQNAMPHLPEVAEIYPTVPADIPAALGIGWTHLCRRSYWYDHRSTSDPFDSNESSNCRHAGKLRAGLGHY